MVGGHQAMAMPSKPTGPNVRMGGQANSALVELFDLACQGGRVQARQAVTSKGKSAGFTLIELLIVVAIIAILAAIAVPNFLEAQTRSKVSRSMADQRSLALALEEYMLEWKRPMIGGFEISGYLKFSVQIAAILQKEEDIIYNRHKIQI